MNHFLVFLYFLTGLGFIIPLPQCPYPLFTAILLATTNSGPSDNNAASLADFKPIASNA